MKNADTQRAAYPLSPCIQACTLDDDSICLGCRRTLQEIIDWAGMTADEQHAVLDDLPRRR